MPPAAQTAKSTSVHSYRVRLIRATRSPGSIAAPRARIAEVICDFPRYPEWVSAAKRVEVVEEYEDGYASRVRFVLDAGVIQDEYTLAYEYAEDISRIEWQLVEPSRIQKKQ